MKSKIELGDYSQFLPTWGRIKEKNIYWRLTSTQIEYFQMGASDRMPEGILGHLVFLGTVEDYIKPYKFL